MFAPVNAILNARVLKKNSFMSTLCAYENYLRDRYILGEPVRYMYGGFGGSNSGGSTSKPKQTVYGPDNEEYTYVDDPTSPNVGRYARQIGGKGGGKTVFLDEVQKADQKRQMEDANKAAQPQVADNRQSAQRPAQEKPARRPVKKVWNLTEIEDANGDFLDVQVKASSEDEAKQIVADALKIQRDTRKKAGGGYSWELQEILEWGERNPDKFKQAVEDAKPQVERPQAAQKTEPSAPQAEQTNADSAQHGSKKETAHQDSVDYSEFADAYKRYRAEDKKVASLKRKASKIQKAVYAPSSGATPEEIQSAKESLAKIRGEISASEKVKESLSPELNSFTKKHNVVFIDGGDSFVVSPSSELLQGLEQRKSLQDRVKKARKKSEDAKKAGLKANASEIASVADKLEGELNRANDLLSQMFPNETVVSVVAEKPKRRRANKKKEPQEERAEENAYRNDASGLGLPGKSDVSLEPDAAGDKDTAYFIRRDLDKVPKDVDKTGASVSPKKVDDSPFDKTSASSKTSEKKRRGRTEEAFPELPPLNGDLQDIAVADEIRRRIHNWVIYTNYFDNKYIPGGYYIDGHRRLYDDEVYRRLFDKKTDARFWIDNEKDILNVLKKELDSGLAELTNEGWKPSSEQAELTDLRYIEGEKFRDTARDNPNKYRSRSSAKFDTASNIRKYADKSLSARNRDEAIQIAKKLSSLAYYSATQGDEESTKICKDVVDRLSARFGKGDDGQLAERQRVTDNHYQRAVKNASKKRTKEERANTPIEAATKRTRMKASSPKEPVEKPEVPNSPIPEQQPETVASHAQEPPAKPSPERWTPLKSKMDDDDKRVVENTRKRLNFGLADFAWRIANAKEKKDWQKAKELTVLAAQRYLEQARRAYRSHGGAEALAAFDESLSGEGLTVGQVRDRVVDKFRQLALMNVADLHKYAGERLDEWEAFSQGAGLPTTKDKIALNRLLDKPHYAPNAVPYTPPEKSKVYEVPIDSLNLDPSRFQFKLNTNAQGATDDLEGAEFDPIQAGIIHVWRDPDDGKDYIVNGHHRFNLAKNSWYDGKVNVRYIDAYTADDAKAFGAVANIADSKGTATDVAEFIRTRGSDDIRTPGGKKIATKNKLLADGRVLSKLDETVFRKLKNGSIDEKTARVIAAELPDDKDKQLRLLADIERLGLDASQAQDRAWAYASIQGEKQQGSLFGDDAPMEYDVESRSKLIGEIRKALGGAKRAAQAGGSSRNNEYWESQKLATNFDRDRAKQLAKSAGQALDFFKGQIRLAGPVQNIIKEETDEYRKAIKAGKGAEKVVERAIERIKDVAQGGDGSVRRVEGLGLEYEDRLPSAKSEQTGQGVEAKGGGEKTEPPRTPSESLRNGTTGEVLEAGGTDRPSDGGDGRNLASVIAEEAKKSDIPESRVREELSSPTDKGSEKTSSSTASSPEGMSDWERELEKLRELNLLEDPDTTQVRKRGSGPNAAVSSSPQTLANGGASAPSFVHTPTKQQRIDAYIAEQRAQGRSVKGLTAEDYARIFPDEEQGPDGEQSTVPRKKRGRPRIVRTNDSKQTAGNSEKIKREAQKSEVPKEQIQGRIAEALGAPSDASKRKSSRRPKNFDSDSIKDDVEKAIQIRDADRSQLSVESIDSIMSIAQKVSGEYGADGLKEFMRRIDVNPTARSIQKLQEELREFLKVYSSNRYKATFIRNI